MNLRPFASLLLSAVSAASLSAQPSSATFRPALIDTFSASYTASAQGDLARGAATIGDVSVGRVEFSVSGRQPLNAKTIFIPGLAYAHTTLDASPGVPLPGSVQELSLSLGVRGALTEKWAYGAFLRPGFYGDFQHLGRESFNAPLFLAAFYSASPTLTWTFGAGLNAFNDHPLLPAVGLKWKFAPEWELDVGFPRTGVTYAASPQLSLRAGLSVLGGNYRITENLGIPAPGIARLNHTYLDLTEIRAGAGLSYRFAAGLELGLDLGATTLRRFDYPDRNFRLNGSDVAWFNLTLDRRF